MGWIIVVSLWDPKQFDPIDRTRKLSSVDPGSHKNLFSRMRISGFGATDLVTLQIRRNKKYLFLKFVDQEHLDRFPFHAPEFKNIHGLIISSENNWISSNISYLPNDISLLQNLEEIYLGEHYQLEVIPEEIFNFSDLKTLGIISCGIQEIPEDLLTLEKLEELHLTNNPISELPSGICMLTKLKTLKLNYTGLEMLPECIFQLKNLQYLDISETLIYHKVDVVRFTSLKTIVHKLGKQDIKSYLDSKYADLYAKLDGSDSNSLQSIKNSSKILEKNK